MSKQPENLGIFVGIVGVGKHHYEVAVIETKGQKITKFEMPFKSLEGSEIHVAWSDLELAIAKYLREETSSLWMNNPAFNKTGE